MSTSAKTDAKATALGTGCVFVVGFLLVLPSVAISLPILIIVGLPFLFYGGLAAANAYSQAKAGETEKDRR